MSLSISNENKNNLSVANESKTGTEQNWADRGSVDWSPNLNSGNDFTTPATGFANDSKNVITMTNEAKN